MSDNLKNEYSAFAKFYYEQLTCRFVYDSFLG